jgi:hypothetical protein
LQFLHSSILVYYTNYNFTATVEKAVGDAISGIQPRTPAPRIRYQDFPEGDNVGTNDDNEDTAGESDGGEEVDEEEGGEEVLSEDGEGDDEEYNEEEENTPVGGDEGSSGEIYFTRLHSFTRCQRTASITEYIPKCSRVNPLQSNIFRKSTQ